MAEAIEIAPDLAYLRANIVNVFFAGNRNSWVLIDAGVPGYGEKIFKAAEARFGPVRPHAIVLTHGHFDHVASALELAKRWNVPVYAHPLEFPYLTGKCAYPQKDPTVGGAMAFLSRFFPSRTSNLSEVLLDLPETHSVPGLEGWMWLDTPGHAPGHVSFWRESDRTLIAGDALATVDLDSWLAVATWKQRISNPPAPFTFDWHKSHASVHDLAELQPRVLACGHGEPMAGEQIASDLQQFARAFAPPRHGRYVEEPAKTNEHGVIYEPPAPSDKLPKVAAGIAAGVFVLAGVLYKKKGKGKGSVPSVLEE